MPRARGVPWSCFRTKLASSIASYYSKEILELAASMWEEIGIRTRIQTLPEDEFWEQRRNGSLACYASRFSVDYNDPDAIIYLFFGSAESSKGRSLCYDREDIIDRVTNACSIIDEKERLKEYRELERIIVQEDCAWIPLFSNQHYFIVNERVKNFKVSWKNPDLQTVPTRFCFYQIGLCI